MRCIEVQDLRKSYGKTVALDGVNLQIDSGRIVVVFGLNGAGKTTLLNALLGLIACDGALSVLGHAPWKSRHQLMLDACFVADVAVLPRWMKVAQVLDHLQGVHPRFCRERAQALLAKTSNPVSPNTV